MLQILKRSLDEIKAIVTGSTAFAAEPITSITTWACGLADVVLSPTDRTTSVTFLSERIYIDIRETTYALVCFDLEAVSAAENVAVQRLLFYAFNESATSSAADLTCIFVKTRARCNSTVLGLMLKICAIRLLDESPVLSKIA